MTEIESWAASAVRRLRALVADAERAAPSQHACADLRGLISDYDDIQAGRPTWCQRLAERRDAVAIPAFLRRTGP